MARVGLQCHRERGRPVCSECEQEFCILVDKRWSGFPQSLLWVTEVLRVSFVFNVISLKFHYCYVY